MTENQNPLLGREGLPAYDRIRPEHVVSAAEAIVTRGREILT